MVFIEYSIFVVIILTMLTSYNRYKKGGFNLDSAEKDLRSKEKHSFKKWFKEIFILRPKKRPFLSAIPQIGIIFSLAGLLVYPIGVYKFYLNPIQPLDKLKKYEGTVTGYKYYRKLYDRLIVQLKNGEKKYFLAGLGHKEFIESKLNKKVTVWTQEERGFFNYGEKVIWKQFDNNEINLEKFNENYERLKRLENVDIRLLTIPIKSFIFFLFLLWFINRNFIESKHKEVKNDNH